MSNISIEAMDQVADAMMVAQGKQLARILNNPAEYFDGTEPKYLQLRRDKLIFTDGYCREGCIAAVIDLAFGQRKIQSAFQRIAIVTAGYDSAQRFVNTGWVSHHDIFIAQDTDGNWYAGSPSNASEDPDQNFITKIFTQSSLPLLMNDIQSTFLGQWPSTQVIERAMEQQNYQDPTIEDGVGVKNVFVQTISRTRHKRKWRQQFKRTGYAIVTRR